MAICMKGTVAHLQGYLTDSGMTHSRIDSFAVSLQQIESSGKKKIRIDCTRILAADISGLQLLYVWMQCARFRGVEPELVNLSESLQQAIQQMGVGHCFTGNSKTLSVGNISGKSARSKTLPSRCARRCKKSKPEVLN